MALVWPTGTGRLGTGLLAHSRRVVLHTTYDVCLVDVRFKLVAVSSDQRLGSWRSRTATSTVKPGQVNPSTATSASTPQFQLSTNTKQKMCQREGRTRRCGCGGSILSSQPQA